MGIFVFPPHAKIPLHDHPGMCVISRLLYGEIHRRSLDLPTDTNKDDEGAANLQTIRRAYYRAPRQTNPLSYHRKNSSSSTSSTDATTDTTTRTSKGLLNIPVETLIAPNCTVLYPQVGNLHEFIAGPDGAAVLDVLLPPYDADHHRDCTFYDIVECDDDDDNDNDDNSTVLDATTSDHGIKVESPSTKKIDYNYMSHPCWIKPIGRPEDFHCLSGQYRTLGG
jgi:PCO_ADO